VDTDPETRAKKYRLGAILSSAPAGTGLRSGPLHSQRRDYRRIDRREWPRAAPNLTPSGPGVPREAALRRPSSREASEFAVASRMRYAVEVVGLGRC